MTDPNIVLSVIPPEKIAEAWPELKPLFVRACERVRSGRKVDDILAEAKAGKLILWTIGDHHRFLGALATGVRKDDGETVFIFSDVGGYDMHLWLDSVMHEIGEKFAKAQGATRAEIRGRPGWERKMRFYGYELSWVCLRKAL